MKILLFGRGGQVGWELQRSLSVLGEVVALDFDSAQNPQGLCGSFSDLDGLAATVQAVKPDVIVNAAAHTAVDKAESEPEFARSLNALAPAVLAAEALKLNAWMKAYAAKVGAIYADYFGALVDEKGWLKESISADGLHPNAEGYKLMVPVVEAAIQKALP